MLRYISCFIPFPRQYLLQMIPLGACGDEPSKHGFSIRASFTGFRPCGHSLETTLEGSLPRPPERTWALMTISLRGLPAEIDVNTI
jgi:hypothetical protein